MNRYWFIPHRAQPGWNPRRQAWTCKRCDARTAFTIGPWHTWVLKLPGVAWYRRFRVRNQMRKQIRFGITYIRRTYGGRR